MAAENRPQAGDPETTAAPASPDTAAPTTERDLEAGDAEETAERPQDRGEEPEEAAPGEAVSDEAGEEWAPELDAEDDTTSVLDEADETAEAAPAEAAVPEAVARRRLDLWRLPHTRSQLSVAVLCALLGFAAVVQVRSLDETDTLQGARQSDLVRILDDVTDRSKRLQDERAQLQATKQDLISGSDRAKTALLEAQKRAETLGILAGTLPAHGPGIQLTIVDPDKRVDAAVLLNTLQELRDAGAEAVQINDVRVVASTDLIDSAAGVVRIDGRDVRAPYIFKVIGEPDTLTAALGIPGGVFAELKGRGGEGLVDKRVDIEIDALRPIERPQYARPARDAGHRD